LEQCEPGSALQIGARVLCSLLLGGVLAVLLSVEPAYADGGAPNLAYVAGAGQGVGMIDIAQQSVTRSFAVAGGPDMLLLSPDGSLLYVTQPAAGSVVALAARTGQVICRATFPGHPALLALSVDATVLYVAGLNETTILALNAQTCAQEHSFRVPEPVHWLAATLSNATNDVPHTQLWMAGVNAVSVLNDQGQVLDTISVAGDPQFLCLPGALTAYVATRQGSVIAIDMLTHRMIATLLTGGHFGSMDYNAVTGEIYLPDQHLQRIDVLAPVLDGMAVLPREPASVLPVNGSPQAIAITNDGQLGFVALSNGQVAMLDIPGRSLIKTVVVGGSPRFIITGGYPPSTVPSPISPAASSPVLALASTAAAALLLLGVLGGIFWLIRRQKKRELIK
jgi:DNA-binding beta-propeller fold protein YncE